MKYPLRIEGTRLRVRQCPPIKGARYRTQMVGDDHHSERIAMRDPRTKKWVTQSWTFPINDVLGRRPKTVLILKKLGRWEEGYKFVVSQVPTNWEKISMPLVVKTYQCIDCGRPIKHKGYCMACKFRRR